MNRKIVLRSLNFHLAVLFFLTACALSPQTISIRPALNGVTPAAGQGKRIAVNVYDKRPDTLIGYRGGVYDTATIVTADDINQTIYKALVQAYRDSGFTIIENSDDRNLTVNINLETLNSRTSRENLVYKVEIDAVFGSNVVKANGEKSLILQDHYTREFATPPTEKQNETIINDVVTKLLQRLVDNQELYQWQN